MSAVHWSDAEYEKIRAERRAELADIDARYPINLGDPPEVQEENELMRRVCKNDIS
jgi:hypothetical protein